MEKKHESLEDIKHNIKNKLSSIKCCNSPPLLEFKKY